MLTIRFLRVGKKNQPAFKIVVVEKGNAPQAGRFVEEVGFYNPLTKETVIREERIRYWFSKGAQVSSSVYNLLVKNRVIKGKRISLHKIKEEKQKEVREEAEKQEKKEEGETESKEQEKPKQEEEKPEEQKQKPAQEKE